MILRVLGALLIAQLALLAALYWPQTEMSATRTALLGEPGREAVSRVAISDAEGREIVLTAAGDGWLIEPDLRADSDKVSALLDALLARDPGFAIAQSEAAAERFEVATDSFERRITLAGNDAGATVFLGSSPALGKVYARADGDNAVYVLGLNSYDVPADTAGWLDRSLLAQRNIDSLSVATERYRLEDGRWTTPQGDALDAERMETLLQALAGLQVSGIADDPVTLASEATTLLSLSATSGDNSHRLTLLQDPASERYYLQSDRYAALFDTSAYDAERLIDAVAAITETPTADGEAPADDAAQDSAEAPGGA